MATTSPRSSTQVLTSCHLDEHWLNGPVAGTRAFTALSLLGKQGNNAFVGDTVGNVMLIDTRNGKLVRKLHGMTGSIVACAAHCAAPIGVVSAPQPSCSCEWCIVLRLVCAGCRQRPMGARV